MGGGDAAGAALRCDVAAGLSGRARALGIGAGRRASNWSAASRICKGTRLRDAGEARARLRQHTRHAQQSRRRVPGTRRAPVQAEPMPQNRKRRRSSTATGDARRTGKRAANMGNAHLVPGSGGALAGDGAPQRLSGTAAALNSSMMVDIGGLPVCPEDVKAVIMANLSHEEKASTLWSFPFKDGEGFETAEFSQLSCYGPPTNKARYVLCSKLGEGSFSCVFKSWDTVAKDFVAMKFTLSR
eukprot:COSAG02_NODE_40_length_47766_cov_88.053119_13_plen_242_part_00